MVMIVAGLTGVVLWWRGRLFTARWYLWPAQHGWWMGFVAVICGWIVTETGRQPWVAYNILRTADAVSPLAAHTVASTLVLFVLVYGIVFAMGIYYINRLIARGPDVADPADIRAAPGTALAARETDLPIGAR
jgi:cytochrome d ubiquinol oxidase subunit I